MKPFRLVTVVALLFAALAVYAQETNQLSEAETQGREFAQKILQQWPAENSTNTGLMRIKAESGKRSSLPLTCIVTVNGSDSWVSRYKVQTGSNTTDTTTLIVTHSLAEPNRYALYENVDETSNLLAAASAKPLTMPFAGSDFSVGDLGLEFFHWPQQKVLKKEVHRSCGCTVLESTNPDPAPGGYSRVVSWIDSESLGIVEAYAYDLNGRELKDFYPKDLKKVNGRYQVQTMVMENGQADTRTRLEFDLDK